jgi:hypothetical protein
MRAVKFFLPLVVFLACGLAACNTVENRRSVYSPVKANGPYTRSLKDGSWKERKTVDVEYREAKVQKRRARTVAPAPAVAPSPVTAPLPE